MKKIYILLITVFLSYPFFVVSVSANINDFVVPDEVNYFESVGNVDAAAFSDFNFSNALFGRNGFNVRDFEISIKIQPKDTSQGQNEPFPEGCDSIVAMYDKSQNLVIERGVFGAEGCDYNYTFSSSEKRIIFSAIFSQKYESLQLLPDFNVSFFPLNYLTLIVRAQGDMIVNFEFRVKLYNQVKIDVQSAYIDFLIGRSRDNFIAPDSVSGRATLIVGTNQVYDYYDFYQKSVSRAGTFLSGDYENMRLVGNTGAVVRSVDEVAINWRGEIDTYNQNGFFDYFLGIGQLNVFSDTMVIKAPITNIEVPGFENTECNAWDFPCHISNAFNSIIDRVIKSLNAVTSSITSGVTGVMASAFGIFAVFDDTPLAGFIEFMAVMFGIFIIIIFWKRK